MAETKSYRLKPGFSHSGQDPETKEHRVLNAGDVVELTEAQAANFSDRFVEVGSPADEAQQLLSKVNPELNAGGNVTIPDKNVQNNKKAAGLGEPPSKTAGTGDKGGTARDGSIEQQNAITK